MRSTRKRCPSGKIQRDAYVTVRRGTRKFFPTSCITNRGNPGKGFYGQTSSNPGIGPLRKGDLKQFGYDHVTSMPVGKRHHALALAANEYGALSLFRKLNAVYVYTKNTAPTSSAVFKADRDWVKKTYL